MVALVNTSLPNKLRLLPVAFACLLAAALSWGGQTPSGSGGPNIVTGGAATPHRGVHEVEIACETQAAIPRPECALAVAFARPDGSTVTVDGFFDGEADGRLVFKARAYCDQTGPWSWASSSEIPGLNGRAGSFTVVPSALPGKLRAHPEDPHQFAYDNGEWFLHIGDTGYRYVVDTEPEWQAYIDQAVTMGATKIRTWFCRSRGGVEALFTPGREALDLPYWKEIDRRLQYALNRYPHVMFQLIPYGEDGRELRRYAEGDAMSRLVARYAQARLSAFPNVTWCISNDQKLVGAGETPEGGRVSASVVDAIGRDMAAREPWGTLLTNHQARYSGYAFTGAPWSGIITFEDLDQVAGALLLEFRARADRPVVNEEDRYEIHERPEHAAYYFRRLMWASLLSGGHATYGGARTYEPHDGVTRGVRGYYDLKKEGVLRGGADSFVHIHSFFKESGLTLAGMRPDDALAGDAPLAAKVAAGKNAVIVYLANPDSGTPETANAANTCAACRLQLPPGAWTLRWFNPQTGEWFDDPDPAANGGDAPLARTAPFAGDAVLLARGDG